MGKIRLKCVRFFLKLLLLFQIYVHHKFEAEAKHATQFILKNSDGIKAYDGVRKGSNNQILEKEIGDADLELRKRSARFLPLKLIL